MRDSRDDSFPIVGVGGSAGALSAFQELFRGLPAVSESAFVVISHGSAQGPRLLPEILGRCTSMPVREARDGLRPEPGTVHVAPPGLHLTLLDGAFAVEDPPSRGRTRLPIDLFFRSLARERGHRAVGIVLSGAGTDGTLGLAAIRDESGMTLAQEPATAEFRDMPVSAIASGAVDLVLPVQEMPEKISAFVAGSPPPPTLERVLEANADDTRASNLDAKEGEAGGRGSPDAGAAKGRADTTESGGPAPEAMPEETGSEETEPEGLEGILALVAERVGRDFSDYKRGTLLRRIERRRSLLQLPNLAAYARLLEDDSEEAETLWRDWLIGVTRFFRDPEAFEALRGTLGSRIAALGHDEELRIWVPGCATGEEAYSLAILSFEILEELRKRLPIRVFATDLDERAIERARSGRYPHGTITDVGPERIERFFEEQDTQWRVGKKIRDAVVFAPHDLLQDPPFTKMDLISCRNLLIYLKAPAQRRALQLLHYSLKPEGLLFLGSSESVTGLEDLFEDVDSHWKIFRRREGSHPRHVPMDWVGAVGVSARTARSREEVSPRSLDYAELLRSQLLSRYAPPAVIADEHGRIEQIHGRTGAFLEPAPGSPGSNVLDMAREGLRSPLATALRELASSDGGSVERSIRVRSNGDTTPAQLVVRRLTDRRLPRPLFLIVFEPPRPAPTSRAEVVGASRAEADEAATRRVPQLEEELRSTREHLQGAIEDLQATNEELASAHEEVQSVNEELQSTNEELTTSKEETQSLNEELQTVNAELNAKVASLEQMQDDLMNLVNVTRVAIVFLDEALRVKRFTPEAQRLFRLIDSDLGRPLADITTSLDYPDLARDAREVSRSLVPEFREVKNEDGSWWTAEIRPYRTSRNAIEGLVFTFVNVTRMKESTARAEEEARTLAAIVDTVREPLVVLDDQLRVVRANASFYDVFRVNRRNIQGVLLSELGSGQWDIPELCGLLDRVLRSDDPFEEYVVDYAFPDIGPRHMVLNARRLERDGQPHRVLLAIEDRTGPTLPGPRDSGKRGQVEP